VNPRINTEDLVDANEVAEILGLAQRTAVSVYRRRYPDFPAPAVEKGRCVLWRRQDVKEWGERTGRVK
jgi:glutathione-regulated potassium-efflux system ancillary protein KefG